MANEIHTLINMRHENKLLADYSHYPGEYNYPQTTIKISVDVWDMFIAAVDQLAKIQEILCPE